jgi:arabinogalactan endo-1,4-beta-galactosidase
LKILHQQGINAFRMRIWNDPTEKYSYANITGTLEMASRCKAHNLSFILDFHYSDWWADPGKQNKPAAWASMSPGDLLHAVLNFSNDIVQQLVKQGTPPVAVQIGNEVSNGFLWAPQGQPCNAGGYLGSSCAESNWPMFAKLIAADIVGVKEACPDCLIAIHTDLGNHIEDFGIEYLVDWYKNLSHYLPNRVDSINVDYDLVGLSMYPTWDSEYRQAAYACCRAPKQADLHCRDSIPCGGGQATSDSISCNTRWAGAVSARCHGSGEAGAWYVRCAVVGG